MSLLEVLCKSGHPGSIAKGLGGLAAVAVVAAACLLPVPGQAQSGRGGVPIGQSGDPQEALLKTVRLDQKLKGQVPLDAVFHEETGRKVRLGDYFREKPVMLMLIQFRCTMLCTEQQKMLMESLKQMRFTPGKEFELLIVSIDPREKPELALDMQKNALEQYGRAEAAAGWHWLTGDETNINRLADAVGFHYVYDKRTDQYAHPDGVILLTPEGKIAQYYFRLEYPARDMQFGLVEASKRKIGSLVDAFALLCFHYNPVTGKYGLAVLNLVRMGGILTVLLTCVSIAVMRRRDRVSRRGDGEAALAGGG